MHVGLFFGSFNHIHIGHTAIANYMAEFTDLDEIWFVVSPHNPLKDKNSLLHRGERLEMVDIAIKDFPKFKSSDVEFNLPQPSYTINTLKYLKQNFKKHTFSLIVGEDNLQNLDKWKNYKDILKYHKLYVYPRVGITKKKNISHKNISPSSMQRIILTKAPVVEISSTFIRASIKAKKDIRFFLPKKVWKYIIKNKFYK